MTTFEAMDHHRLTTHPAGPGVFAIQFEDTAGEFVAGHAFHVSDAPQIASAVLEDSGVEARNHVAFTPGDRDHLEYIAYELSRYAKARVANTTFSAEDAKRNARRDELARDLIEDAAYAYRFADPVLQAAIDRIIELEAAK